MRPDPEIEAIEVRLFLEAIYARYGYDMRGYARPSIERRVAAALAKSGLPHLGELQHRVLRDPALFGTVVEDLTVRVSSLFRDPTFYRAFRERIVPILRTYPQLKIWHSGCASGEEVYASAIVLAEEGLYDRAQIYATDVSVLALEHAKEAVYSAEHLLPMKAAYALAGGTKQLSAYYTAAYDRIALDESLKRNVLFFQHDLVSDHVFGEMNVVFCRNVLIYFGSELRDRVIGKFSESLCHGGFLCLGQSERLRSAGPAARFNEFDSEERIYRHEVPA